MKSGKSAIWSGFWARLLAWIIDCVVLGIVCYAVGSVAPDYASSLGSNGRFFGLVLGILYFGFTASGLLGGRSIGMRICKLKVVGLKAQPLGLAAALGRAVVLVGPVVLNGWFFNLKDPVLVQVVGAVAITAVFGIGLSQLYLLLFNSPTRRLVHDLVFGSVVVRAEAKDFEVPPVRAHAVVVAVLILAALGVSVAGPSMVQAWMPHLQAVTSPLQKVMTAVNALPEVSESGVDDNTATYYQTSGPPKIVRTLTVTARVRKWPANSNVELARIGAATVNAYSFAPGQQLTVKIIYGFDLGFGASSRAESNQFATQCTTADVKCLAH